MSEVKHTPGPWKFTKYLGNPEDLEKLREFGMEPTPATTNEGQRYIMAGSFEGDTARRVALVDMQVEAKRSERYKATDPERDANARLIAAAPDLLEACEHVEAVIVQPHIDTKEYLETLAQVRAAIAKAKGESE